ncbi:hypothetical protein FOXYSP1_13278 [Fusarium oxysporum f. sp. phaseoli]
MSVGLDSVQPSQVSKSPPHPNSAY